MRKTLLFLPLFLLASEPSAFEAGNLDQNSPYGLSQTEQYILNNKKAIDALESRLYRLNTQLDEASSAIEGFRSVARGSNEGVSHLGKSVETLQAEVENLKKIVTKLGETATQLQEGQTGLQKRLDTLAGTVEENSKIQNDNAQRIATAIKELSDLVDNINRSYVSDGELKDTIAALVRQVASGEKVSADKIVISPYEGKNRAVVFEEGRELFGQRKFDAAKERFLYLASTDYQPAYVRYYLGECYYQTGEFPKAVAAFKESVRLDDKASYVPILLFHTGVAFQKMDNNREAARFYETLISLYPDSSVTASARSRLEKIR